MSGLVYSGNFEQTMNELCNTQNIAATAKKFAELEKQYGPYSFGKFVKFLLPRPGEFAGWDKDSGGIPEPVRQRLTEVISANLRSESPLPVVLKVGENVDATHDLHVRTFAHGGRIHLGLHMLCSNPELK